MSLTYCPGRRPVDDYGARGRCPSCGRVVGVLDATGAKPRRLRPHRAELPATVRAAIDAVRREHAR